MGLSFPNGVMVLYSDFTEIVIKFLRTLQKLTEYLIFNRQCLIMCGGFGKIKDQKGYEK